MTSVDIALWVGRWKKDKLHVSCKAILAVCDLVTDQGEDGGDNTEQDQRALNVNN